MVKNIYFFALALMCITISSSYGDSIVKNNNNEDIKLIKLTTNKGNIVIKLFEDKAPETVKNFINYTNNGSYNGTIFHRVIKNFMIQGGGMLPDMSQINSNAPVVMANNNLIIKGTIAMARQAILILPHPFFINLKDNEFLTRIMLRWMHCVFRYEKE